MIWRDVIRNEIENQLQPAPLQVIARVRQTCRSPEVRVHYVVLNAVRRPADIVQAEIRQNGLKFSY